MNPADFIPEIENVPGIGTTLYYAFPEDFVSRPSAPNQSTATNFDELGSAAVGTFQFKTGKCFKKIETVPGSATSNSKTVGKSYSLLWENTLKFMLQGDKARSRGFIDYIKNRKIVILAQAQCSDGNYYLYDCECYPATVKSAEAKSGNQAGDASEIDVEITNSGCLVPIWTGSPQIIPQP